MSGLIQDKNGTPVGAAITFKNTDTGETFQRRFEGMDDMIQFGLEITGPEAAFNAARERQQQQYDLLAEQAKAAQKQAEAINKQIMDSAKAIYDAQAKDITRDPSEPLDFNAILQQQRQAIYALYGIAPPDDGQRPDDEDLYPEIK